MSQPTTYGNQSTFLNNIKLRFGSVSPITDKSGLSPVIQPDCISCTKHRTGIPKNTQCQAICNLKQTKQQK
jgi:hypothetical protein